MIPSFIIPKGVLMRKTAVLVVEDEAIVAADLAGKLRQLGYEVAGIASEGEEAVALAVQSRPDLVLMDIRLEGPMDGIEAADAIRRRHEVPVVYLTAHSDAATLARAKVTGPFGYILKPFEERDLATQIELALYKFQADRQIKEQREWLRVTLTSIGDAVIATDPEGRITFINPVAETLTGWKGEEAMGLLLSTVFRTVNEHTGRPLEDPLGRVLREGHRVPIANYTALMSREGRTVPIEDSAAPILNADGRLLGAVLVFHDVTEKRRAEEALRQSEERLRFQRERMPIGCIVHDDELRFVELNPAAERILGYRAEELIGRHAGVIVPPETRPHVEIILRRLAAGNTTAESVNENLTRDNRIILCDWLHTPLKDSDGKFLGVLSMVQDITERRQAEAELRTAEELARQRLVEIEDIYQNAPVGLCILDRDLRFVRINEHLAEINGIPAAEHIGRTVRELMPELADTVEPEMRRILETGEPRLNLEIVSETPAQPCVKRSWLEQWLPITDAKGQVTGLSIVVEETTERKRLLGELERSRHDLETRVRMRTAELAAANTGLQEAARALTGSEEKLRRTNELLQKVFDGITDPLLMMDGCGLLTMINKAAMTYYGVGEGSEVLGKLCYEGLRGRETVCPECNHPFLTAGARTMSFERNGLNDPGRVECVTVYPVFDEQGRRDAVIVRISDITQAKILERQILQNEKLAALGLVTSGIAHEINNPNSFIHFNLPILRRYLEELMPIVDEYAARHPEFEVLHMSYGELREDVFKLIENMEHGSQRISKTIGVLRNFVKKRDSEGMQKVDLRQLVDKVVALCHTELRHKVSSFEIVAPEDLPPLISDPDALEQVLLNLLINAIHACDKPNSCVSLKIEHGLPGPDEFILEVTDNGSGIDDTLRERIFDPFFTTKSSNLGTGLGLYICHNHVSSLGGRIEVKSKVGWGTTFRVVLPSTGKSHVAGAQSSRVR
jgi:PAS domain S-box-containing protein